MRVAVFTETFLPKMDGIVRVVCLLLDHLSAKGIETVVVAPKLGEDDLTHYHETRVISVHGLTLPIYPELKVGPPTLGTYRELQDFKPDIAHFIHPVMIGVPGMMMAKHMGIPTLASFHLDLAQMATHHHLGFMRPVTDYLTRLIFNWADYALAPSKLVQRNLLDLGVAEVGLWKRGVDSERFHPRFRSETMRHYLSEGHPDEVLLLYVGRLSQEKKVEQFRAVLDALPHTRLAIVGDGPYRSELEKIYAGSKAHFVGYLHGDELSQAYASADAFVFASALESFGLVVVEAMAAGLPVVASQVGGIPDVVTEGVHGYTFAVNDEAGLVEGVRQLVSDRERMRAMGVAARRFAETQSWGYMMDEVVMHYERLIDAYAYEQQATA